MNNLVSIIMPSYNSSLYIDEAVQSVINQSYQDWELIVIDDCSKDNSVEIIQAYLQKDSRIILLSQSENGGPAKSRNIGIQKAEGRYITFLDSDDFWEPDFLQTSLQYLNDRQIEFCFASYHRITEQGQYIDFFKVPDKVNYYDLLKTCPIPCLTAIYDTSRVGKHFMPPLKKRQDYGLWLSLAKEIDYMYGIEKPLATYRIRKNSVSRNKFKTAYYQWKIYREVEKINFFKSVYYIIHYTFNGILKYAVLLKTP
ncbi:MAG: glycosyltransferase family 2 protein [Flavobacteriaceae bacterium]